MHIKDIEDACRRVLTGDDAALEKLGLDNVTYRKPAPQNTSTTSLQAQYNAVLNTAVAARELQFSFLEKQCQFTLEYILAIAAAKKVTMRHLVDGRDVAEIMLSLIDEESKDTSKRQQNLMRAPMSRGKQNKLRVGKKKLLAL